MLVAFSPLLRMFRWKKQGSSILLEVEHAVTTNGMTREEESVSEREKTVAADGTHVYFAVLNNIIAHIFLSVDK